MLQCNNKYRTEKLNVIKEHFKCFLLEKSWKKIYSTGGTISYGNLLQTSQFEQKYAVIKLFSQLSQINFVRIIYLTFSNYYYHRMFQKVAQSQLGTGL